MKNRNKEAASVSLGARFVPKDERLSLRQRREEELVERRRLGGSSAFQPKAPASKAPPLPSMAAAQSPPAPAIASERRPEAVGRASSNARVVSKPPPGSSASVDARPTGPGAGPAGPEPLPLEVRARYLGVRDEADGAAKPAPPLRRTRDNKPNFDWDPAEDTSAAAAGGVKAAPAVWEAVHYMRTAPLPLAGGDGPAAASVHWSEKPLREMTDRDWRILAEDYGLVVQGRNGFDGVEVPRPLRSWDESGLPEVVLRELRLLQFREPTPIQRVAVPVGMRHRDMIGLAETGSGKTLAFVLPLLMYISDQPPLEGPRVLDGPYAVVMAPTRELVQQIELEARRFTNALRLRTVPLVGGVPIEEQASMLRRGCEIIVATPGRLLDCLKQAFLVLNQCNYVVLDEADKMIEMGFEEQVDAVLASMPRAPPTRADGSPGRTTIMFTATMPPAAERLAHRYLTRPVRVSVGTPNVAVDRIHQRVEYLKSPAMKLPRLLQFARTPDVRPPIIVFCNQKKTCDEVAEALVGQRIAVAVLHSGKSQAQREASIGALRAHRVQYLVATDVAARGIDVKGVTWVVNYDMPGAIESYVHRIGRTGRAGMAGSALSFVCDSDAEVLPALRELLTKSGAWVPHELAHHPAVTAVKRGPGGGGRRN